MSNESRLRIKKICGNCRHSKLVFEKDLYCMNPECDKEFTNNNDCDHYMGVVSHNNHCILFEPLIPETK